MHASTVATSALFPAVLLVSFGVLPRFLPAQSPDQAKTVPSALPTVQKPVTQAPTPQTPEQIGDSLVAHLRYQAAIEAYAKAPQMTATLWNKMGIAYQMLFNTKDAARCYKESLQLDPHNPHVLNNLGTLYASLKQYGQADRMYHKSLKIDPNAAIVLKNLGTNQLAEKKYSKGWATYQQALAINPQIFVHHPGPTVDNPSNVQERGAMNYYTALGCARAGYTDCALEYLRLALDEGFTDRKKVAANSEFAGLRANPAFKRLIAEENRQ